MKYNWTTKKLSEIAYINPRESIGKGVVAKKVPMDKLQPFCRDVPEFVLEEYKGGTKFRNGDTIMARITPCLENGKIAKVSVLSDDEVGFGSTEYIVFRAIDGVSDADFLYYLICSPLVRNPAIKSMVGSSGRQRVQTDVVAGLDIELPPIEEQRKIGGLLKAIDDKIGLNNTINNNLEQQAQLLFKSWFVEFEPFNGTMPSDWEVVPFEKIVDFQNGYAFKSKELLNEPSSDCYQVFKQGHIARGGGFIPDGTKSWYPKRLASKLERFVLKKGDILMAMTDMKDNVAILGNTAIMPIDNEYIVNQRVGHLRANGYKGITYPFIYLLTNSTDFLIDLRSRANSGVQVNLSSAEIKASQTVLPSEKVNTAFSEITLPMFEAIISNQLENQRLAQLRDALLPKLMSGELDVSNIEL
jgi:type I restriction enzyme S subunit